MIVVLLVLVECIVTVEGDLGKMRIVVVQHQSLEVPPRLGVFAVVFVAELVPWWPQWSRDPHEGVVRRAEKLQKKKPGAAVALGSRLWWVA